jgi:hypothetical protein
MGKYGAMKAKPFFAMMSTGVASGVDLVKKVPTYKCITYICKSGRRPLAQAGIGKKLGVEIDTCLAFKKSFVNLKTLRPKKLYVHTSVFWHLPCM